MPLIQTRFCQTSFCLFVVLGLFCSPVAVFAQPDTDALARRLLNAQGCKACHQLDGEGGSLAPDLSKVGSRLNPAQLRDKLVNPQKRHANNRIADFSHLGGDEIDALVTFLSQRQ